MIDCVSHPKKLSGTYNNTKNIRYSFTFVTKIM